MSTESVKIPFRDHFIMFTSTHLTLYVVNHWPLTENKYLNLSTNIFYMLTAALNQGIKLTTLSNCSNIVKLQIFNKYFNLLQNR